MSLFGSYFIATIAIVVYLLIVYVKWSFNYWRNRNIPYLEPSFPFGNFTNPLTNKKAQSIYYKEFYDKFKKMGKKAGGIYTFLTPTFIPVDPEFNKHILVKDFQSFHARGLYNNEKHQPIGANLFNMDGEKWKILRTKFTPTFTSAKMKHMFHFMTGCSTAMDKYIRQYAENKTPVNIKNCVGRLTTDIIGSCAFGMECNSFEDTTFQNLLMYIFTSSGNFIRIIVCNGLPTLAKLLRIPAFPEKEVNIVAASIEKTINVRKEKNISRNDFLQLLTEMKDNDIVNMDEIKAQCLLFFLGGYETSATTMTFTLFELACNQDVQGKLRKEIHDVLAKYNNILTYEAIHEMKYLQMTVDETLRKYPPAPFLLRKCVEDFSLPNSNMTIEKNTNIIIPVLGLHHDPDYFSDPDKYDPERFTEENKKNIVPYSYLPFGEGPRNCIGDRFGKLQVKVGLATLINKYKFTLNSQMKIPLEFTADLVLTSKQPILLNVESISTA